MPSHPLATLLRGLARSAPNPGALVALADYIESPRGQSDEALRWFEATVRLVDGTYVPCASARRHLEALTDADDLGTAIARLTADELAAGAVAQERTGGRGLEAALADARDHVHRIARARLIADTGRGDPGCTQPFVRWTDRRRRHQGW